MLLEVTDAGYYGKPPDCATEHVGGRQRSLGVVHEVFIE